MVGIIPNFSQLQNRFSLWNECVNGYGFSVSKYSLEELDTKKHNHELSADAQNSVHVHIDSKMMGIGGYDSWTPNVDEEYLINHRGKKLSTNFRFSPLGI